MNRLDKRNERLRYRIEERDVRRSGRPRMGINIKDPWRRTVNDIKVISDKPKGCEGCPLFNKTKGFVPGTFMGQPVLEVDPQGLIKVCEIKTPAGVIVSPRATQLAICGEAPSTDEILQNRPFSGAAGNLLKTWILGNAGLDFENIFVDNTLRCVLPNNKVPDKEDLRKAIKHCAQYDLWNVFSPTHDLFTFHPSALFKDVVPLPLVVHDVGKAREMAEEDSEVRVRILMGGTAIQARYPYATSVARWRGHVVDLNAAGPQAPIPDWKAFWDER